MSEFLLGALITLVAMFILVAKALSVVQKEYKKEQPTRYEVLALEVERLRSWGKYRK